MKTHIKSSILVLVPAVSAFAAAPDAGALAAAVGPDVGALSAAARSGAGSAQANQMARMAEDRMPVDPVADIESLAGALPFEFRPTKDFPVLSLSRDDMDKFNALGRELVDFGRQTPSRIDNERTELIGKIRAAASNEAKEASDRYKKALQERIEAGNALNDLKLARERAETARKHAEAKAAEARTGVERVEARIAEVAKDKQELDREVRTLEVASANAAQAGDRAEKEAADAADALAGAKTALETAKKEHAEARKALEKATAGREKAEQGLAKAQTALEKAGEGVDAARGKLAAARKAVRAEKRVADAKARVEEAKAAADKGWFARLFAPSPEGAAADLAEAEEALAAIRKETPPTLADAEKALAAAHDGRDKASAALKSAKSDLSDRERAERDARREAGRKADAEARAAEAVPRAETRASKLGEAAAAAKKEAAAARQAFDELKEAQSDEARSGLVNKKPLEEAKARETAANKDFEAKKKALADLGEDSGRLAVLEENYRTAENKWRAAQPAFQASQRRLDAATVRTEANKQVLETEERLKEANLEKEDVVWNRFLDDKLKAAGATAGRAATDAPKRAAAAKKAAEEAKTAHETAKARAEDLARKASEIGRSDAYRAARRADENARDALESAEKAFKKAQAGQDEAALAAAKKTLAESKSAAAKAAKAWEQAQAARKDAFKQAREAEEALPALETKAKETATAARKAEKDVRTTEANRDKTERRVRDAVAELREMFDEQVAAAAAPGGAEEEWEGVGRTAAQRARSKYEGLRGGRDRALAAWRNARANLARRLDAEGTALPWANRSALQPLVNACEAARRDLAKKREAFDAAEDDFNTYFSDADFKTDLSVSDDEVSARYEGTNGVMARALYRPDGRWTVRGDRRWLARTSVNGENLLDVLRDEFAWQAEALVDAGEAKRDPYDPLRVELTAEQSADCAAAAAAYAKRRAIYGGYYFCGIDVDEATGSIWVDKGRFGPATVHFVDAEGNVSLDTNGVENVDGRIYTAEEILAKFASPNAPTNTLEGETFNFVAFQKAFNKLNANPDIAKADVVFDVSSDYAYNYDRDQGWGVEDIETTNTMTRAVKAVVNVQENRRPAPLHGVLSIDNFNSMGDQDKVAGDADTWMARLQLQRRLGLFSSEDALSLSGNMSLGGSLWGVAGSYYVPRGEDSRFWRSGETADALAWTLHGGYTDVDQADVIDGLDILGTGYYGGLQASTRLHDSGRGTWDASLGFTYRYVENSVRIEGEEIELGPDGDGYTLMPLSLALMYADKDLDSWRGRNFATVEFSYNVGGSSLEDLQAFRPAIDEDRYAIVRAQLARLQLLWEGSDSALLPRLLFLKADAQWALDPVIGAEQFGLGGHGTVRGYAERSFMGDQGFAASLEFRTPILLNPAWLKRRRNNPYASGEQLQLVYFVDGGWYNLQDASPDGDEDNALLGVGLGLRYSADDLLLFGRGVSPVFRLDWAYPVWQQNDVGDDEKSSAGVVHASLQFPF